MKINSADCVNKIVEKLYNEEVSEIRLLNKKSWKRIEKQTISGYTKRVFEHRECGYKANVDESNGIIYNVKVYKVEVINDDISDFTCDEDKVYSANELYFTLVDHGDPDHGQGLTIYITPIDFWERHHCLADFIGGHNVDSRALINGGSFDVEEMEAVFSPIDDNITIDELKASMINAGFTYSEAMFQFLNRDNDSNDTVNKRALTFIMLEQGVINDTPEYSILTNIDGWFESDDHEGFKEAIKGGKCGIDMEGGYVWKHDNFDLLVEDVENTEGAEYELNGHGAFLFIKIITHNGEVIYWDFYGC
jgi:hypothetical protein